MVLVVLGQDRIARVRHVKLRQRGHASWPLEVGHFFALRR
jgi:hypothetical protein